MLLIFAAILGAVVIACFYVAMWLVAIVLALGVFAFRFALGQRGDQLWRRPWMPRIKIIPAAISQMRISDRR